MAFCKTSTPKLWGERPSRILGHLSLASKITAQSTNASSISSSTQLRKPRARMSLIMPLSISQPLFTSQVKLIGIVTASSTWSWLHPKTQWPRKLSLVPSTSSLGFWAIKLLCKIWSKLSISFWRMVTLMSETPFLKIFTFSLKMLMLSAVTNTSLKLCKLSTMQVSVTGERKRFSQKTYIN